MKLVTIRGNSYAPVIERLRVAREKYPQLNIETVITYQSDQMFVVKAIIRNGGDLLGCGHASEIMSDNSKSVNHSHALENAETSAVGRALMFAGFDTDGAIEIARNGTPREQLMSELRSSYRKKAMTDTELLEVVNDVVDLPISSENLSEIGKLPIPMLRQIVDNL